MKEREKEGVWINGQRQRQTERVSFLLLLRTLNLSYKGTPPWPSFIFTSLGAPSKHSTLGVRTSLYDLEETQTFNP